MIQLLNINNFKKKEPNFIYMYMSATSNNISEIIGIRKGTLDRLCFLKACAGSDPELGRS